jgi:hypothetical protein
MKKIISFFTLSVLFSFYCTDTLLAEMPAIPTAQHGIPPTPASIIEKPQIPKATPITGGYKIGNVSVNTILKEASFPGRINMDEGPIEFIASIKGGFKLYESLLELDVNAYEFNLSLILIGLDQDKGVPPKRHFDPKSPQGDPVEVILEWEDKSGKKSVRIESTIKNVVSEKTMPLSDWVYTGSVILPDGTYMAQRDGVLVSFVRDPAAIIDSVSDYGTKEYGSLVANKQILPPVGTPVTLKVISKKK